MLELSGEIFCSLALSNQVSKALESDDGRSSSLLAGENGKGIRHVVPAKRTPVVRLSPHRSHCCDLFTLRDLLPELPCLFFGQIQFASSRLLDIEPCDAFHR